MFALIFKIKPLTENLVCSLSQTKHTTLSGSYQPLASDMLSVLTNQCLRVCVP